MQMEWRMRLWAVVLLGLGLFLSEPARAGDLYKPFKLLAQPFEAKHREKPVTGVDCSIEQLADQIDWLEHHIDTHGSIVAKHPDVWGESRLMRHRYEYEEQMAAQLGQFKVLMNAALRRSDQSFLGMAFALQAAAGGQTLPDGTPVPIPGTTGSGGVFTEVSGMVSDPSAANSGTIVRSGPFALPKEMAGFGFEDASLSLEPTIQLDQRSRYLNHLHELRRINEGDDIADSPGYALNLVRIPVSILPGKHTRKGYGAEITITAEPYLSDELLPTTFRNLVINDLVDQLAYPMTRVVNSDRPFIEEYLEILWKQHFLAAVQPGQGSNSTAQMSQRQSVLQFGASEGQPLAIPAGLQKVAAASSDDAFQELRGALSRAGTAGDSRTMVRSDREEVRRVFPVIPFANEASNDNATMALEANVAPVLQAFSVPVSRERRSRLPLAPTMLLEVFDVYLLGHIAADARFGLSGHPVNQRRLHLMDVRAFLSEELPAAYDFLESEERIALWGLAGPELASAIRGRDRRRLEELRESFLSGVGIPATSEGKLVEANTTVALAWAILVQASLLNERLTQDIHDAIVSKRGAVCLADVEGFYHPQPSQTACAVFNEYVACRWPLHVFALDPVTQDQNVADTFSRRRELQVAAALAFAGGEMNAQALMRFTRRLEWDMATISLNRTAVAFSHGADTFGWRFQPRFQTPPMPGTFKAFGETLLGGPTRDADMSQRELESGIRECTAIVVMPSFVPYATFDVRTNWYKLTDPKCTEISMRETMELSRGITAMRSSAAQCAQCAHLYRDGEVARMLRRVDQLERELPLQTMQVQIPYENTSGGFEIFNRGITDLAPELIGWYGAPGISRESTTTMFLVGDGFSVHDTRVIAGGRALPFNLISRQLMQVDFPTGLQVLNRGDANSRDWEQVVDVHLATPYGVSSHLLVPISKMETVSEGVHFEMRPGAVVNVTYTSSEATPAPAYDEFYRFNQDALVIRAPRLAEVPDSASITFYLHDAGDRTFLGSFSGPSVALSKHSFEYRFSGSALSGLVNQIEGLATPYLKYLGGADRLAINVSARMPNNIPVAEDLSVVISKRQ